MMAISLGEGIGLTATEVINENDQVVAIPLKESHHHADYAVGYHRDNEKGDTTIYEICRRLF